jgi:lycopene cyclase domain-containing protein
MKEYTLIAISSVILTVLVDKMTGINILKKKEFYLFILIIFSFKLLVNGYLTGANIVMYNPRFFLGLRLGSIPLEDFLFGFSMVSLGIILWEFFKQKKNG